MRDAILDVPGTNWEDGLEIIQLSLAGDPGRSNVSLLGG